MDFRINSNLSFSKNVCMPCKKCDRDSGGNSGSFHVTNRRQFVIEIDTKFHVISCLKSTAVWSKSTPNPHQIPCHLSKFYLFSIQKHDIEFGQVQVMEFPLHLPRTWWDFHRIWYRYRLNCRQKDEKVMGLPSDLLSVSTKKTWENPWHIFYRGSCVSWNINCYTKCQVGKRSVVM